MAGDGVFALDDALDELYGARPQDFTALRTELAAKAKRGGDAAAAKQISTSRKPTTAAWVVNTLVRGGTVTERLTDLGSRLREAHAAMDGETIRALTTEQRKLVDELTRAAFRAADLANPSAALRDDVVATLQAAVADPDVAARLGRLTKAEQWSGFGEFGYTAAVSAAAKDKPAKRRVVESPVPREQPSARDRRRQQARAAVAAAERAKAEADAALSELQADLATARLRHQDARRRLADAEQALTAAEDAYDAAKRAGREAGAAVKSAKQRLKETDGSA
ncbi:MAG: TolC family protein [Mycobacterium sp.]|nr:TolC family protein [Mycobacterium sp.]